MPHPHINTEKGQEEIVLFIVRKEERKNKAFFLKEKKRRMVFFGECYGSLVNIIRNPNSWGCWEKMPIFSLFKRHPTFWSMKQFGSCTEDS